MGLPQVAIVGRPNVGKSSLFNWLARKRIAIVDDRAGVTRDRLSYLMEVGERYFELVDTGGMGAVDADNLTASVEEQIDAALETAAVVLFVVDAQSGLTPHDQEVAKRLRYLSVPVICVANKTDHAGLDPQADEFYKLGRGKLLRVSVHQNRGREELLELIADRLPAPGVGDETEPSEPVMKVAIVGRRNTGKSTFVNTLAKAERMIVSEVPGTTRDSVDVRFELDGKSFIAIDTPGIKRAKSVGTDLEFYSSHRAYRSIRRADVVLLFFDATQRISKIDKQLCAYVTDEYKPCVLVVNKWDLQKGAMPMDKWASYLRDTFRTMGYAPIAFITGQTGKNVKALLNHAQMLYKQSLRRVTTGELNRLLEAALKYNAPPAGPSGAPARIYYATQIGVQPPTIVLFCNHPDRIDASYRRYLLGFFREKLDFGEVPIKLYLRRRGDAAAAGHSGAAEGEGEEG